MFHITSNKQLKIKISSQREIFYQLKTLHCTKARDEKSKVNISIAILVAKIMIEVKVIIRLM
jgi:hypothetical protein